MKSHYLTLILSAFAMLLASGCVSYSSPVNNPAAAPMPEPIRAWGANELIEERNYPMIVRIVQNDTADTNTLSDQLQKSLSGFSVQTAVGNTPCDIQIMLKSDFKEIAPLPQLRMYHNLEIATADANGIQLLPPWTHKSELAEAFSSADACRSKLLRSASNGVASWVRDVFTGNADAKMAVSVVRFRLAKYLIDLNFYRIETEQRELLNALRKINGVYNVRMIEFDADNRIVSFRVLYRKDRLPQGIVQAAN